MTSTAVGTANPFPGPRAFTSAEEMFGRTRDAEQLVRQLVAERIVLLYSPSGAGKTSLLRAKIRSMLEQEGFYVLPEISVGDELHDDHKGLVPNRYLASAISSLKEGLHQEGESFTVSEKFADTLAGVCGNSDRSECVVFFDQFEQLVTKDLHDTTAKFEFMREVGEALQQRSIWALFAMREDYVPALDPYLHVIPTRLNSRFRLDFLTREGAREAIQQPPSAAGRPFAPAEENGQPVDPVSVLLDDLEGAGGPPRSGYIEPLHLQVVCRQLWSRLGEGDTITPADVESLGSVDDALRGYIDDEINRVAVVSGVAERKLRKWFEAELIVGSFRRQTLNGPEGPASSDDELIQELLDTRLVRTFSRGRAMWLELAHDRLVEPVQVSNDEWGRQNLTLLERSAERWEERGRPNDGLLTGTLLRQAKKEAALPGADLSTDEQLFLSRSKTRNRRRLTLRSIAAAVVVLILGLSVAATVQWRRTQSQATAAVAAGLIGVDPALAVELALQARSQLFGVPEAEDVLRQAIPLDYLHSVLAGHSAEVTDASFSPDGTMVVTASLDFTARIWDKDSGDELAVLVGHRDFVNSAEFSPDGSRVLTASFDGTARVWDAATGESLMTLSGHEDALLSGHFNHDGSRIITASFDGTARIWDAELGVELQALVHDHAVMSAEFSPDGLHAVTASFGFDGESFAGESSIWNVDSGIHVVSLTDALDRRGDGLLLSETTAAVFSPDGEWVAVAANAGYSYLWNWVRSREIEGSEEVAGPEVIVNVTVENHAFTGIEITDTMSIVTASGTTASLWTRFEVAENVFYLESQFVGHTDWVNGIALSPDQHLVATASRDGTARVWEVASGGALAIFRGHTDSVTSAVFSPDGRFVVTTSDDDTARIWQLPDAQVMRGHTGWVLGAEISDDGELLVSGGADETVRLWDLDDASQILMVTEDADGFGLGFINDVAINSQKTHFASAGEDGFVYIWDRDGEEVARRVFDAPGVRVDFDPTGDRVLVVAGGVAFIWPWRDAEQPVLSLSGHKIAGRNRTIAGRFSPDGSRVVTGGQDGRVIVWDASTASVIATMDGHQGTVFDVAFSWDGTRIVSAGSDKTARIWDAATGEELRTLSGHESRLAAAAFSPDGTQVVTGTSGGTVGVWDVETGKNLAILRPHSEFVNAVAFHPDGATIVSASDDHTVRRYGCVICGDLDSLQTTAANRKGYARDLESQLASAHARVEKVTYPWQLVAGDCLLTPDDLVSVEPVSLVPCEEEHQAEVVAMVLHPAPPNEPYPDDLSLFADAACRSAFAPYVGSQLEISALSLGLPYGPLEETWDTGSRLITCWLIDPAGPMVGSMRNSGR